MAQERTLGIANAPERVTDEPSKEELQRRMEEARESISETVTEIKETVAQQVENVKDALDWREHVKKRPVAWSLGALGAGFLTGYCIANAIKGDSEDDADEYGYSATYARSLRGEPQYSEMTTSQPAANGESDKGPGLLERFRETSAYDRLSKEVGSLGDRFVEELSATAHTVVLPLVLNKIRNWIGLDLAAKPETRQVRSSTKSEGGNVGYEPILERSQ